MCTQRAGVSEGHTATYRERTGLIRATIHPRNRTCIVQPGRVLKGRVVSLTRGEMEVPFRYLQGIVDLDLPLGGLMFRWYVWLGMGCKLMTDVQRVQPSVGALRSPSECWSGIKNDGGEF